VALVAHRRRALAGHDGTLLVADEALVGRAPLDGVRDRRGRAVVCANRGPTGENARAVLFGLRRNFVARSGECDSQAFESALVELGVGTSPLGAKLLVPGRRRRGDRLGRLVALGLVSLLSDTREEPDEGDGDAHDPEDVDRPPGGEQRRAGRRERRTRRRRPRRIAVVALEEARTRRGARLLRGWRRQRSE
jgi:hypothetical protein